MHLKCCHISWTFVNVHEYLWISSKCCAWKKSLRFYFPRNIRCSKNQSIIFILQHIIFYDFHKRAWGWFQKFTDKETSRDPRTLTASDQIVVSYHDRIGPVHHSEKLEFYPRIIYRIVWVWSWQINLLKYL